MGKHCAKAAKLFLASKSTYTKLTWLSHKAVPSITQAYVTQLLSRNKGAHRGLVLL